MQAAGGRALGGLPARRRGGELRAGGFLVGGRGFGKRAPRVLVLVVGGPGGGRGGPGGGLPWGGGGGGPAPGPPACSPACRVAAGRVHGASRGAPKAAGRR